MSEDSDFVPAVDFVQEMRNKQIVHVGFGGYTNDLRSKCRHRIDLGRDRLFRRIQRSAQWKPPETQLALPAPPRVASNAASASARGRGSGGQS